MVHYRALLFCCIVVLAAADKGRGGDNEGKARSMNDDAKGATVPTRIVLGKPASAPNPPSDSVGPNEEKAKRLNDDAKSVTIPSKITLNKKQSPHVPSADAPKGSRASRPNEEKAKELTDDAKPATIPPKVTLNRENSKQPAAGKPGEGRKNDNNNKDDKDDKDDKDESRNRKKDRDGTTPATIPPPVTLDRERSKNPPSDKRDGDGKKSDDRDGRKGDGRKSDDRDEKEDKDHKKREGTTSATIPPPVSLDRRNPKSPPSDKRTGKSKKPEPASTCPANFKCGHNERCLNKTGTNPKCVCRDGAARKANGKCHPIECSC